MGGCRSPTRNFHIDKTCNKTMIHPAWGFQWMDFSSIKHGMLEHPPWKLSWEYHRWGMFQHATKLMTGGYTGIFFTTTSLTNEWELRLWYPKIVL